MHISKLQLVNYRNFACASFHFNKSINTIIGENGSGKSNVFRAIRLLLDENMSRSALRLEERDFNRGLNDWRGHWIIISLEFEDVSDDEAIQALFMHQTAVLDEEPVARATLNLIYRPKASVRRALSELDVGDHDGLLKLREAITTLDYEPVLTGRSTANFTDPLTYRSMVGNFETVEFPADFDTPEIGIRLPYGLAIQREVCFTYVQALRDVVSEFHNNKTNPLFALLRSKTGEIDHSEFDPIVDQVGKLNESIELLTQVRAMRSDIHSTINDAAGDAYSPASLSIRSDLPAEAEKLFQSLKLFVGETDATHEDAIHELSLGGANLIFLTLKLLAFKYQRDKQSFANFLLIEEPEAHIHTHIQKTLFDRLQYSDTQVIFSTHSTQISEVSNIRNVNILGRTGNQCEVYQPAHGLTPKQQDAAQRYLDAVRCNLLFAKSVVLVEGDAEEILIPTIIKAALGISLDELGVSLINIRSTGFENVANLFHLNRIRKRCSIITDRDATFFNTDPDASDDKAIVQMKRDAIASAEDGNERFARLNTFAANNPYINVFFAPHTFEVDFIAAGNSKPIVRALPEIYEQQATIERWKNWLEDPNIWTHGWAALDLAKKCKKGWFAILIGKFIEHNVVIPEYILQAILFAHGSPNRNVLAKILRYRAKCSLDSLLEASELNSLNQSISQYEDNILDLPRLHAEVLRIIPNDSTASILTKA